MGYECVLIQVRERFLMDLDEANVFGFFCRAAAGSFHNAKNLWLYEQPGMANEPVPAISLGKMSLALHHLLTGEFRRIDSPLSRAILGGAEFRADVGDGPARYLWAEEVREISAALAGLTTADLRGRYDPAGLKAAWPMTPIDSHEDERSVFDGLAGYLHHLTTYYRIAAGRGHAMLIGVV